jgi:hypothetical protein
LKAAYAAIVAGLGLALLIICIRRRRLNFVLFVAGAAVWFAALCFYNTTAFGNPFAIPLASGESAYPQILSNNPIYAATGLIFDRYRGLLPYSPILLLSVLGLRPLLKERPEVRHNFYLKLIMLRDSATGTMSAGVECNFMLLSR